MTKLIGIFAGTFDPIHQGHIDFARTTALLQHLDKVIFLPERIPRHKTNVTSFDHRYAMLQQALTDQTTFDVMAVDESNFSVEHTLPKLLSDFEESELTLLIGSDVAGTIGSWPHIENLLAVMTLAIGLRGNDSALDVTKAMSQIEKKLGINIHFAIIETETSHIASSTIRFSTSKDRQFHPAIHDHIKRHNLYDK